MVSRSSSRLVATLTGEILPFDKDAALRDCCERSGIGLSKVMLIDVSAAKLQALFLPIPDAGGVVAAFNPTSLHKAEFDAVGIPVIPIGDSETLRDLLAHP